MCSNGVLQHTALCILSTYLLPLVLIYLHFIGMMFCCLELHIRNHIRNEKHLSLSPNTFHRRTCFFKHVSIIIIMSILRSTFIYDQVWLDAYDNIKEFSSSPPWWNTSTHLFSQGPWCFVKPLYFVIVWRVFEVISSVFSTEGKKSPLLMMTNTTLTSGSYSI